MNNQTNFTIPQASCFNPSNSEFRVLGFNISGRKFLSSTDIIATHPDGTYITLKKDKSLLNGDEIIGSVEYMPMWRDTCTVLVLSCFSEKLELKLMRNFPKGFGTKKYYEVFLNEKKIEKFLTHHSPASKIKGSILIENQSFGWFVGMCSMIVRRSFESND